MIVIDIIYLKNNVSTLQSVIFLFLLKIIFPTLKIKMIIEEFIYLKVNTSNFDKLLIKNKNISL